MSKPAVILHVFGRMQRGGAELRTLSLMRRIDKSRWQFHFGVLSGLSGELDDEIRALGGVVHPMRLSTGLPFRFRRVVQQARVAMVHSHVHYSSGLILRLAAKAKVRARIAHFRSTGDGRADTLTRRLRRAWMKRWIDRNATHIVAVGEAAMSASWSSNWTSDPRCRILYNGLDLHPFQAPRERDTVRDELGFPADTVLYCHVGRLQPPKNHLRLIDVTAALAQRDPLARLVLIGRCDEPMTALVKQRIASVGLTDRVCFAGDRHDVARLLLASDAMIFPSTREGLPGAVLEACAAGLPVVASDLPGIREIAHHFPSVRTLSLSASDDAWATAAIDALVPGGASDPPRWDPEPSFRDTPFHIERAVASYQDLYTDAFRLIESVP